MSTGFDDPGSAELVDVGLQVVARARVARTGEDRAVDPGRVVDTDNDARDRIGRLRFTAADRILKVLDFRTRVTQFGREVVAPLREQASRIVVRLGAADAEGVAADRLRAVAGEQVVRKDARFLKPLESGFETMIIGDLKVGPDEVAVVLERTAGHDVAGVDAVDIVQHLADFVELGFGDADLRIGEPGAIRAEVLRLAGFLMLVGTEQEQAILDHRAAQVHAPALFRLDRCNEAAPPLRHDIVGAQAVVGIFEEATELVVVGARLGDDVDRAAGELAVVDVERGELDLGFTHGVVRDRGRRTGREAGVVEAEDVALADPVNGERVAAVVAAEAGDAVGARATGRGVFTVEADARVEADDVADVAVEARCGLQHFDAERSARADGQLGHLHAGTGNDDLASARREREGQVGRALQRGVDLGHALAFVAAGVGRNRVRAADDEVGGGEAAVRAGHGGARGAGTGVGHDNGRASEWHAVVVFDSPLDSRGDLLRHNRCRQDRSGRQADDAGSQEILELHGEVTPWWKEHENELDAGPLKAMRYAQK